MLERSYRARYHASETYRRARRRERRERAMLHAAVVGCFFFIALALANVGAAILRSL